MTDRAIVRWGGIICQNDNGADYIGGSYRTIAFQFSYNFEQLLSTIHSTLGLSDNQRISNVIFRQPIYMQDGITFYTTVPVSNHLQLFMALEGCKLIPQTEFYQFFVEIEGLSQHNLNFGDAGPSSLVANINEDVTDDVTDDEDSDYNASAGDDSTGSDEEETFWSETDDDDVNDDEQDAIFINAVLPVIHPPPYAEIDYGMMQINTYAKPGGHFFDPSQEFTEGMMFPSRAAVTKAAQDYSLQRRVEFMARETRKKTYVIQCANTSTQCAWRLRATCKANSEFWTIVKYNGPHTCVNVNLSKDHRQLAQEYISRFAEAMIRAQPDLKIKTIQAEITDKVGYEPSYRKCWKAKQIALKRIFGGWEESYGKLPRFLTTMERVNYGSPFVLEHTVGVDCENEYSPANIFDRCFWTYYQVVEGFKFCRPVILVDGTFLYGKYSGCLLYATSLDDNNQIYPLAFAVVEKEK